MELTTGQPADLEEVILRIREARQPAQDLLLHFQGEETDPRVYWAQQISKQVAAWNGVIDKYLRPVEILMAPPAQLMSLGEAAHESRREALAATFSLRNIVDRRHPRARAPACFSRATGATRRFLRRCASGSIFSSPRWSMHAGAPRNSSRNWTN